jgi:hypothetical protein
MPLNLALPTLSVESGGIAMPPFSPTMTDSMPPLLLMRSPTCLEISREICMMFLARSIEIIDDGSILFL